MSRLAVLLIGILAAACGTPPPDAPARSAVPGVEALRAFEQGNCAAAAPMLREALVQAPRERALHYALAVCATHLDIRQEAITHFQWVLANAAPESAEAKVARDWLMAVGVIPAPQPAAAVADAKASPDPDVGNSTVRGQIVAADGPVSRVQLFLKGRPGTPTAAFQYVGRTRDDGRFQFTRIPAGTYMLTNTIAGKPQWRLRVEVPQSGDLDVQLTAANRFPDKDDFPEDGT